MLGYLRMVLVQKHQIQQNEFVAKFYGREPLWKTPYSMGIVVKAEEDDDFYIVMECSNKNTGFKHTQIILTMDGCL